jgi:Major tropism determinant N-terminal domain
MSLEFRRGADAARIGITPASGEPLWTTDTHKLYVGDGVTPGGILVTGSGSGSNTGTFAILTVTNYLSIGTSTNYSHTGLIYANDDNDLHIRAPSDQTIYIDASNVIFQAGATIDSTLVVNTLENDEVGYIVFNAGLWQQDLIYVNTLSNITVTTTGTFDTVISGHVVNTGYSSTGISGTSPVTIATFDTATSSAAKYLVRIKDGSNFHLEEIVVTWDGTNIYASEYGILTNTGVLGTFSYNQAAGIVQTIFTPSSATNMTIKTAATLLPQ